MSDYAIQHLKDLDDSAVQFGLSPDVEARFGRKAMGGKQSGLSYQRLAPGYRQGFGHKHERQEETYVVVSGSGRIKIGDEVHDVRALDAIRLDPDVPRAFEAGPDGIEFIAFGAGESGDAEILEDFWPTD
jgi:mannose-6-phosphate isomerase-like protein (cupin superfamily)